MILCTLKKFMEIHGINQNFLSTETGITRPTISQLVKNENQNIKYENINTLCKYFNIQLSDLLIYSPIEIVFEGFKVITKKVETVKLDPETMRESEKPVVTKEERIVAIFLINDERKMFENVVTPFDLEKGSNPYFVNPVTKIEYDAMVDNGFNNLFFKLFIELIEFDNKYIDFVSTNNLYEIKEVENIKNDNDNLIEFWIKDAPDIEEIKSDLKRLPKSQMIEIKKELNNYILYYNKED